MVGRSAAEPPEAARILIDLFDDPNAYVLALSIGSRLVAALVALGGKLGDRFGGVTTFRLDLTVFFVASQGCGLAPQGALGEVSIVAARALQGAGAALKAG